MTDRELPIPVDRRQAVLAAAVIVVAVIVALIGLIASSLLPTAVLVLWVFAILAGGAFIPAAIYILGPMLPAPIRKGIGKLLFIAGQLTIGRGILWQQSDSTYVMRAGRVDGDTSYVFLPDHSDADRDGWVEVGGPMSRWSRLGFRPFAVSFDKRGDVYHPHTVDGDDAEPAADGGDYRLLGTDRGGHKEAVPNTRPEDHVFVRAHDYLKPFREAAGSMLADKTQEVGFRKYGGNQSLSTKWLLISLIALMGMGSLSGYIVFF